MDNNNFEESEEIFVAELVDEDGNKVKFEHIATLEYEGRDYVFLGPIDEVEGVDKDDLMIMRIEHGEEEDIYMPIEDEAELYAVFDYFKELVQDEMAALDDEEGDLPN